MKRIIQELLTISNYLKKKNSQQYSKEKDWDVKMLNIRES